MLRAVDSARLQSGVLFQVLSEYFLDSTYACNYSASCRGSWVPGHAKFVLGTETQSLFFHIVKHVLASV